jgi:hypothetical protein
MKVRIGVADSSKIVELKIDDAAEFKKSLESAVEAGGVAWFENTKGHEVGIPTSRISYVEVESGDSDHAVGFAPAV